MFDRNKGATDVLYRRALREHPELQGKVVLEVTVTPDGEGYDVPHRLLRAAQRRA